jgi:hypothetical protein
MTDVVLFYYVTYKDQFQTYFPEKVKLSHYSHAGVKEERRYSPYSFFTSALDGVSGHSHAPAALYPWERTPVPIG